MQTRNAAAAQRWSGFNTELQRVRQGIGDLGKELRRVEERIRAVTARVQTWARGPERDSGSTRSR